MCLETRNKQENATLSCYTKRNLLRKKSEQDRLSDMKMVDSNKLFTFLSEKSIRRHEIALEKNKGQGEQGGGSYKT